MTLREIWRRITTTRYTRALETELAHLEGEIALLRAENRALLNSILGIAGIPPIPATDPVGARHAVPGQPQAATLPTSAAPPAPDTHAETETSAAAPARLAAPMRRRSWQQINRMLEFESAKKKTPEIM